MLCSLGYSQGKSAKDVFFHEQVAPLLVKNCIECHNSSVTKGKLNLETLAFALKGGDEGKAIVVGNPEQSLLYQKIIAKEPGSKPEMPRKKPALAKADVEKIKAWIEQGANWPKEIVLKEKAKADSSFWSFKPIAKVMPPVIKDAPAAWKINPIDAFVFAKLKEKGLQPSTLALPRDFIRRATYDLIGLPPTLAESEAFAVAYKANSQQAINNLVDRLLASPRYGEHWGRHWLDVIRFGESRGYERNEIITNLWPFRDYVIKSINEDKPFDVFIKEHLAGDVMGAGKPEVEIASAFLVAGPYDDVGNQDAMAAAQIRSDQMDEMIRATSEAFLGLTMGCARCHDHKFDPLLAKDYYSMFATFAGVVHGPREVASSEQRAVRAEQSKGFEAKKVLLSAKLKKLNTEKDRMEIADINKELAEVNALIAKVPPLPVWWVGNHKSAPGPFHVYLGGSPQKKGDEVFSSSLSALNLNPSSYKLDLQKSEAERRVALANWITAPDNPLSPRVLANRVWQYHFGTGIVDTPSDFGFMGGRPTHPELLDWLATMLQKEGWQLKPLHKLIMTSQAYQQSSAFIADASRMDGDTRYLWRFPPRRLQAEEIRDTMLSIASKLDLRMGGVGFRLYEYQQDNVATYVPLDQVGPETYRRAIYHHNARAARVDLLADFDAPDPALAEPRRATTTTPLQALTMMNHKFTFDMANFFAQRVIKESPTPDSDTQIKLAFQLALARDPSPMELKQAKFLVTNHGLRACCRALLNSNELINLK